ncbi:MAG: hypothetical protein GY697_04655 [Desulfobacterales bacterium]|nr:hypothetical protein [Desulfobacterales bacterium]
MSAPISAPVTGQKFALELFQALCRLQPGTNTLVSPLSVYTALMMTANGARGATRSAMTLSLGIDPADQALAETQLSAYLTQVQEGSGPAILHLANAIWTAADTPLENAYVRSMATHYQAAVLPLPTNDPAGRVNHWVSEQTRGKIPSIVEQIDPNLAMLLLNAAYFKDAWQTPFPVESTAEGPFYLADGQTKTVAYMGRHGQFDYLTNADLQVVSLPYRDPRFRLILLLPAPGRTLKAFIKGLDPMRITGWLQRLSSAEGRVVLPRFQLETGYSLRNPLTEMGMDLAFDTGQADFSGITARRPFAVGDVKHRCLLKVDETGSEAAAVTSVEMVGALPPAAAPFEFIAERPFLCLLQDRSAGRTLFMAAVYLPEAP